MSEPRPNPFLFGDRSYGFIKRLVQIVLPAFGTFYFALAGIWDLPNADKVTGTVLCVSTFLGVCLGISSAQYNSSGRAFDGNLTMQPATDASPPRVTGLALDGLAEDIQGKKTITLKVKQDVSVGPGPGDLAVDEVEENPQNPATRRR